MSTVRTSAFRRLALSATLIGLLAPPSAVLAVDNDGDSVEDASDNCPTLYNPDQDGGLRIKLNGPLVTSGAVVDWSTSPDGARVVYRADQQTNDVFELYSVSAGGGAATKLNLVLPPGGDVLSYIISPDSARVVYRADQNADQVFEIYSVPIGGGTVTKLNAALTANGDTTFFSISPNGLRVVYHADQEIDETFELYGVPISGGAVKNLNAQPHATGDVGTFFLVSSDSMTVVYQGDLDLEGANELYSVPIDGGSATKLNPAFPAGRGIGVMAISLDGNRVIYRADQDADEVFELYSVPLGGGVATKLNAAPVAGGDVLSSFLISADSARVVYMADQDTDEVFELYSVPLGGGVATKLNTAPVAGGHVFSNFLISADSARVVYPADQDTDEVIELYSVPIGGGGVIKIVALPADGDVGSFTISPDSAKVVYLADQDTDEVVELYAVPIGGGSTTRLNHALPVPGGRVFNYSINPDSSSVVYRADQDTLGVLELYSVAITGGALTRINAPLVASGSVGSHSISSDGRRVVYLADQDTDAVTEIYATALVSDPDADGILSFCDVCPGHANPDQEDLDGDGAGDLCDNCPSIGNPGQDVVSRKINGPLVLNGDTVANRISPDSSRTIYVADQDTDGVFELYSVPIDGGAVTKLNAPLVFGGDVVVGGNLEPAIAPDGARVVYRADQDTDGVTELYSVPIGGGEVTKLNAPLVANGDVQGGNDAAFIISGDSSRVVYRADQDTDGVIELYSVPIGGGAVTKLNPALAAGGNVANVATPSLAISPDSARVIYAADQTTDEVFELYSVPIGGGAVTKLNTAPVSGGDLQFFSISPDSTRVVYTADQDTDEVVELYSVPIGGGAVVKINAPLVAGGVVTSHIANASRVVYIADQDTDNIFELYSVPIGGGAVTKLSAPMPAVFSSIQGINMSPDGARVLYLSDRNTDEVYDVYSVPTGGGPVTKLNGPLSAGNTVSTYIITPDSARVVYRVRPDYGLDSVPIAGGAVERLYIGGGIFRLGFSADSTTLVIDADPDGDGLIDLYGIPVLGGPVTRLNPPMLPGRGLQDRLISPDSSRIVYRADQETDNVFELYTTFLVRDSDGDGIQSICDVCPAHFDPGQADFDADSTGDVCDSDDDNDTVLDPADCLDINAMVWDVPGQTRDLLFSSNAQTLSWSPPLNPGGVTVLYDTLRSILPSNFVGSGMCLETDDGANTFSTDTAVPAPGTLFFYLNRAGNACGEGSLGTTSSGVNRQGLACP